MMMAIQHYFNPLHIYCRLRDAGIPRKMAGHICCIYENIFFKQFTKRQYGSCPAEGRIYR